MSSWCWGSCSNRQSVWRAAWPRWVPSRFLIIWKEINLHSTKGKRRGDWSHCPVKSKRKLPPSCHHKIGQWPFDTALTQSRPAMQWVGTSSTKPYLAAEDNVWPQRPIYDGSTKSTYIWNRENVFKAGGFWRTRLLLILNSRTVE